MELHLKTFPLAKAIEDVCARIDAIAEGKGVNFAWIVEARLRTVTLDLEKLHHICYHFLANAVNFAVAGDSVNLEVRACNDDRFELRISNKGVPMKHEELERIFRPRHQVEMPVTEKPNQKRFAIEIIKRMIECQNGSIAVETGIGIGTVFILELPRAIAARAMINELGRSQDSVAVSL